MSDTDKCPLCGGKVLYRGFTALECNSRQEECRNGTDKAVARWRRSSICRRWKPLSLDVYRDA